jgi:DME family drug/metabolite transporter
LLRKDYLKKTLAYKKDALKIFTTSFFGVFVLYYFEIWALKYADVPVVSFLLYASGIIGMILSVIWLKESINKYKVISAVFVVFGVFMIFSTLSKVSISFKGGILAIVAGLGYSIFLILTKKFNIPGTLATLWWLFGFGSFFLFIPFVLSGHKIPSVQAYPYIICLSIIPTMGGYYCTNKALSLTEASHVQIFEMSEPIFASAFAFVFLNEIMSINGLLGAVFITIGLLILQQNCLFLNKRSKNATN